MRDCPSWCPAYVSTVFYRKVSPHSNQVSKGQGKFPKKSGSLDRPTCSWCGCGKNFMKHKIKTYRDGQMIPAHSFFILNKGLNSGRPSLSPCSNCYILTAGSEDEHNRLYWLSYALWATGKYRQCLIGSVIPFIRIDDTSQLLDLASGAVQNQGTQFTNAIEILYQLQHLSKQAVLRVKDIQVAKMRILRIFSNI